MSITFTKGQLYGRQWRKAKALFLARHPYCVMCHRAGKLERATTVDHIKPHKGDVRLFWQESNWQGLCKYHHNSTKQAEEKSGKLLGIDRHGRPTHPDHPWNQAQK